MVHFVVLIATYNRPDGSTFPRLKRCLDSIIAQTHQDFTVVVVGDKYGEGFKDVHEYLVGKCQAICFDLLECPERTAFLEGKIIHHYYWCCGGVNAMNSGLDTAKKIGGKYICHMDDDDIWFPDHLSTLNDAYTSLPEAVFVYTQGRFNFNGYPFPQTDITSVGYDLLPPRKEGLIHAAASWRVDILPQRYATVDKYISGEVKDPGDALMWEQIREYCQKEKLKTVFVPRVTVIKL